MKQKPGGLTAVCIIALVLGGMGIMTCFSTLAGFLMQSNMQAFMPPGNANGGNDAVQQMQTKMNAVQLRWRPVQIIVVVLHAVVIAGLLAGGILALQLKPLGRKILMFAFLGAIPFDIGRLVPLIAIQLETMPIMEDMMKNMPQANGGPGAAGVATIMKASLVVGMVFAGVWFLIKLIFFIWGTLYLRKPEIVELFTPENPFSNPEAFETQGFGR